MPQDPLQSTDTSNDKASTKLPGQPAWAKTWGTSSGTTTMYMLQSLMISLNPSIFRRRYSPAGRRDNSGNGSLFLLRQARRLRFITSTTIMTGTREPTMVNNERSKMSMEGVVKQGAKRRQEHSWNFSRPDQII